MEERLRRLEALARQRWSNKGALVGAPLDHFRSF